MLYVIRCIDKKDHLPVRQENRPAHIEYLQSFGEKLFAAGAILDDSEKMCGSIVILDVADKSEAEAFAVGDPYAKAGLFEATTIDCWKKVLP
ncbi:MAG: YciI family protein [Desulfuromusa sp.]|nr:YciI family protein [Desulfuromusa sp.]